MPRMTCLLCLPVMSVVDDGERRAVKKRRKKGYKNRFAFSQKAPILIIPMMTQDQIRWRGDTARDYKS